MQGLGIGNAALTPTDTTLAALAELVPEERGQGIMAVIGKCQEVEGSATPREDSSPGRAGARVRGVRGVGDFVVPRGGLVGKVPGTSG